MNWHVQEQQIKRGKRAENGGLGSGKKERAETLFTMNEFSIGRAVIENKMLSVNLHDRKC